MLSWLHSKVNYKILMVLPPLLVLLLSPYLFQVKEGLDLSGGARLWVELNGPVDRANLENLLKAEFKLSDIVVREASTQSVKGLIIEASTIDESKMLDFMKRNGVGYNSYSSKEVGSKLGSKFKDDAVKAVLVSFLLMSIVIFIAFRSWVPSLAVIQCAACDILFTVECMSLFGISMNFSSVASLLMLIGYSVDTDILLTSRVLKGRSDNLMAKIDGAFSTGMTMIMTTLVAVGVMYYATTQIIDIPVLAEITSVLVFGLLFDIPGTWLTNAGLLRWYVESKKGGK